jgi:hypothetical protein
MNIRRTSLVIPLALLSVLAAGSPPAASQTTDVATAGIYRLDKGATYQTGCFEPCLCPILVETPVRGTMTLTHAGFDGLFDTYKVGDVNWTVSLGDPELRVTGSGTYRIGGEFALRQQLELDLVVGENPVDHFDSGLVPARDFPSISVTVSIHGMYCHDTVFVVNASPVPERQIRPYRLYGDSTFQRGCVGMCDCLAGEELPIQGTFALVDVAQDPALSEFMAMFAVVNVRLQVDLDGSGPDEPVPVRGFGAYNVGGEVALEQRLVLDLEIGAEPQARFDSGRVRGGANFPLIDARIVNGDPLCFETVIDLHARPRRPHRRR